ncbi:cyclic nucleotide-binding domain-containing protein [Marinihelvus fidelis]|uniref:Cyclic nucleotide-binding domain-containing protein n=1 Tax=Marinihelvus fidelis TaxID=2613842 RepID=A0A5N0TEZ8_9GAMM|nr:cyclic nucleotide-binding and patatin-like phospholipase domain-containing protein [Marinihelvus fidelis]KAA9132687.1 cyclic nucleotide-binding domain-containing protein [Marinihelvus fidelis]
MSQIDRRVREIIEGYFGPNVDDAVYAALKPWDLKGGDWLFHKGDTGDALYFLVRGRLQAYAGESADDSTRFIGEVRPGQSVGEAGLLTGQPRSAGIRASRDSLLIRLEKADFERLAGEHPGMVMKLAAHVARLMQQNLAGQQQRGGGFSTVTLLTIHDSRRARNAAEQLARRLADENGALWLRTDRLDELGAPTGASVEPMELPERLKQWLADQENEHPLVVYQCGPGDSAWTRFAVRQADIVMAVADTAEASELAPIEDRLAQAGVNAPAAQALALVRPAGTDIGGTASWIGNRPVDFHLHLGEDGDADLARITRVLSGRAVGLVLGAGAVRGLSELGVYKAMVEAGVPVDWVGGSSIGSIVGAAIAHGWDPDKAIDVAREAFVKGRPFSDYTLPLVSLIRGKRMTRLLESLVDADIEDLPLPYFCVSSKLDRGEVHVHRRGSLVSAIRASAALPGVLPPAVVDSELVVDGAVLNNLPVDVMERFPVGTIIAIDVSSRHVRQVDYGETPSSWAILRSRLLPFTRRQRVPGLATLIMRSTEIGTLLQSRAHGERADLLINPPVRQFGLTDVSAYDQVVEAGYQHAREIFANWTQP